MKKLNYEAILVTGGTGFIGSHCVKQLVDQGFNVKVAIRSKRKFDILKSTFSEEKQQLLSYVIISDISDVDELKIAVKDCDGVIHLASPFTYNVNDFEKDLIEPALRGTIGVLEACMSGSNIKRIVITSSFAAIYDASKGPQPGVILSEKDFSPLTWDDGLSTKDPSVAYRVSKTLAEKAAWEFMTKFKPNYDISVICPTMVFGPLLSTKMISSLSELNLSNQIILKILNTEAKISEVPATKGPLWVDVRDLAYAHVEALINGNSSNQRYLVSAGDYDNQEIADILREGIEQKDVRENVPIGNPGERQSGNHFTTCSHKAERELGVSFRPLKDSILDFANQIMLYES